MNVGWISLESVLAVGFKNKMNQSISSIYSGSEEPTCKFNWLTLSNKLSVYGLWSLEQFWNKFSPVKGSQQDTRTSFIRSDWGRRHTVISNSFILLERPTHYAWIPLSCFHPGPLFSRKIHLVPNTSNPFLSPEVTFIKKEIFMLTLVGLKAKYEPSNLINGAVSLVNKSLGG